MIGLLTPERLLPYVVAHLQEHPAGAHLAAVVELAAGSQLVGPPDPPPYLVPLFRHVSERAALPPGLLAALSGALTGYDPAYDDGRRRGVLGLATAPAGHVVRRRDLALRDVEAVAALGSHVTAAAHRLAELRGRLDGGLPAALFAYIQEGGDDDAATRTRTGLILGAWLVQVVRQVPPDAWAKLEAIVGGGS